MRTLAYQGLEASALERQEENGPIDVDHPWYSRAGPDRFPALRHLGFCVGLGLVVVLFVYGLTLKIPVVTEGAEQGLSLSETPLVCGPRDRPFTAKIVFLGTQKPLKEMKSSLPWVPDAGLRHGGFARWTADRGKCLMVKMGSQMVATEDCATSFTGFVFKEINALDEQLQGFGGNVTNDTEMNLTNFSTPAPYAPPAEEPRLVPPALRVKQPRYIPPPEVGESFWQPEAWFQIELMHDATQCLSRVADNVLMIEPCARVDAAEFQNQHFTLQRLSWCNGDQTAYQVRLGDRCLADAGDHLVLRRCDLDPAWVRLQPVISERKMVLSIHPDLQDNHRADLGETYMGNPGVHLPWDVKHLVEYPWAGDHCSAPKPLYSDPSQACYDQFKHQSQGMQVQCPAEPEDTHLLGDGKGCTGLCGVTSTDAPCSCGTMSCPGCVSGFGYNALTDSSWLPPGCIFVGCTQGADPAKPEGSYSPFLIPGGFNIRTCPSNALDGRAAWNDVARKDEAAMCAMDADCAGEEFVGRMSLSGRSFTFCCPGATSNPFSVLSLGYFGVMPENGHYGANGVECNATGCSYRRSCACPWSVPAFNLRVTGPSTRKTVFIPHPGEAESFRVKVIKTKVIEVRQLTEDPEDAQIIIAPHMDKDSKLSIYAVAMGSDDSFHVGDGVNLNPPGVAAFLQSCTLPCERRHECAAITLPHYPGFGGPQEINPSGLWNVKEAPGPSLFDDRSIVIAPKLTKSTLHMGPVFIGHPGKTYVGDDPDVRGIFQGLENRPTDGPGSAPGGPFSASGRWRVMNSTARSVGQIGPLA
ncbi:unnamed protein product [Durusdinium trenchii]|uniref:Post-SET domain-containing protein n=1 Tax=Durusdinium trenchii TaxID=1381693 RepID=A0ABP0RIS7_9DINO